ncbi:hypothetical protein METBIDRAFT_198678 [Metschnikowia bicuspidata var. bicuspidata NRRL YB-4993]|uniref:Uncharacterized protein n=1 Tax=Metschnikowia bicuspidata var. bicuspidata NRRL YB-4993 TaxID=869754 RepID=A0A1A0H8I6_9ASCO|nr:hypothetical protein METBIDRAFT_198678 [Metschnikowia bicuspidata var. bicuspidata NRRL YB-4993]OBA20429.1 hypothetical protein METBIDRAFT_198678 [Metschnikowia bicuspidata var. bicuspidata NRRL YB-4993]
MYTMSLFSYNRWIYRYFREVISLIATLILLMDRHIILFNQSTHLLRICLLVLFN